MQHRQVAQTQKIHFEQAQLFQCGHDKLGDHIAVIGSQWHIMIHRFIGDDHTCRMGRGMPGHTLQTACRINQPMHGYIVLIHLPQLV